MNEEAGKSLARAVDWLLSQQAADGGWHSQTYGQLKDGAAVTTLILDALSLCPQKSEPKPRAAIAKAFAFLDRGLAKRGTVASPDGTLDFPTYAAALWLTSRRRLELPRTERETQLVDYLVGAQVADARGFAADSASYGGWDFLGPGDAQGITTGTNISVSRYVLEALNGEIERGPNSNGGMNSIQLKRVMAAIRLGKVYVLRCLQAEGGFAFTCELGSLNNKAAYADDKLTAPRPYGTATCDGILALLACAAKSEWVRIAKAVVWLVERPSLELVPGFEGLPPESGWDRGLRYYYYAGLARVLPAADVRLRSEALAKHVVGLQRKDGSFVNDSDRMRENDPLIATALAVVAASLLA